jgi:hypothetical protein
VHRVAGFGLASSADRKRLTTKNTRWRSRNQKGGLAQRRQGRQGKKNCVMLNEVKHLLCAFSILGTRTEKSKQILRRYAPQNDTREQSFRRVRFAHRLVFGFKIFEIVSDFDIWIFRNWQFAA